MNQTLPDRIFICGFMGAGKSTVGRKLAHIFEQPFYDLDEYIEEQTGSSIPEIFDNEGENEFRKQERTALLSIIRSKEGIIALGGGTLQNQHIVDHIKVNGLLVFIRVSIDTVLQRVLKSDNRPMLWNEDGSMKSKEKLRTDLAELYKQRLPFYEQAEVTINSDAYDSADALVNQLAKKIKYHVALY